jgi:glycosyltransferase involved in cell wall biosynthesis
MSARVSVVIPCFNQGRFLPEAIQSVYAQTHPAQEIIVVDDGSTDETAAVARSHAGVQYIRQDNAGPGAARNCGSQRCTGDFVVFLDADDHLLPNHFAACLRAFAQKPESVMVWGDFRWFGAQDTWHVHDCTPRPDYYGAMLGFKIMGPPATVMLRRSILSQVGGFRSDLPTCEDLEMWLRIARSHPVHCHHELIAEYRRHQAQMHQRWDLLLLGGVQVLREQRRLVNGHQVYEVARRAGLEQHLRACGEPLLWQTVAAVKSGRWRQAMQNLWVLLRFYPHGVLKMLQQKLTRPRSSFLKVRQPRT